MPGCPALRNQDENCRQDAGATKIGRRMPALRIAGGMRLDDVALRAALNALGCSEVKACGFTNSFLEAGFRGSEILPFRHICYRCNFKWLQVLDRMWRP